MKTPDIEGVANHGGPESCVGAREGVGEALTGARAGWDMEPRNNNFVVPTPSHVAEDHTTVTASASWRRTRRGLRPHACMESSCARTGRSHARPTARPSGRSGKAKAVNLR